MILCFSATGNSQYCAEVLADATDDSVVSINDCLKHKLRMIDAASGERLGIVCPIYNWDIPWVIADFLKECKFENLPKSCYVYAVFTCGKSSGYADETVSGILSEKGIALSAAYAVCMPDTYIPMFPLASVERQQKQLKEADITLAHVKEAVSKKQKETLLTARPPRMMYRLIRKKVLPGQKEVKRFWLKDACVGCGTCEDICPQNIIQMQEGRPVWTEDNCACCLACLHRCPAQAIQYGRKTEKSRRYMNPNISCRQQGGMPYENFIRIVNRMVLCMMESVFDSITFFAGRKAKRGGNHDFKRNSGQNDFAPYGGAPVDS